MKTTKTTTNTILSFATLAFALASSPLASAAPASELARVRQLANRKISGSDVRKEISVFDNKDGQDPCAPPGITYVVDVEVRKSVMKQLPNGEIGQEREWQDFNRYLITKEELLRGEDLNDSLCME